MYLVTIVDEQGNEERYRVPLSSLHILLEGIALKEYQERQKESEE